MLRYYTFFLAAAFIMLSGSCKKLIEIDPPTQTIGADVVFSDPKKINAALANMYSLLMTNNGGSYFSNGSTTIYCGLSADELVNYSGTSDQDDYQFTTGQVLYNNEVPSSNLQLLLLPFFNN